MSNLSAFGLATVYDLLTGFAHLDNFWGLFDTAFGTQYDRNIAEGLRSQWLAGDFREFPPIEVVSQQVLGTANGAYATSTNTIYLSDRFIASATAEDLTAVVLEEFGHFVDAQVNQVDTPGDEGELFSDWVRGVKLSESELTHIQGDDDHAVISINEQQIAVERSDPGNAIANAYDLGALNYSLTSPLGTPLTATYSDTIRLSDDPDDYYKFTIDKTLGIGVNWTRYGFPTTKLELLRSDGTLIVTSQDITYGGSFSLGQNLDAGTYYLRFNTDNTDSVSYYFTLVAGPVDNAGNDSAHAKHLGTIGTTPISQSDYVSSFYSGSSISDDDYYQFTLSQRSQVTFNLTDSENSSIVLHLSQRGSSLGSLYNGSSQTSASLVKTLGAGTYSFYISGNGANDPTTSQSAAASYTIALSAASVSDPGNTKETAYDLGALNYSLTPPLGTPLTVQHSDDLRSSDGSDDYYKFTMDKTLGIVVNWNIGTYSYLGGSTTKLELLRSDGTLVTSQNSNPYGFFLSLGQNLDAGTYYLRFNTDSTATVNYDFTLVAGPVDKAGNDSAHAKDLGTIGATPISQSDYVYSIYSGDSFYDLDYYQFTLSQASEVTFNLIDGENSFTYLSLDPSNSSLYNYFDQTSASLVTTLGAGTYAFYISGNGANDPISGQSTPDPYTIALSAVALPDPGNAIDSAYDLGALNYSLTSPLGTPLTAKYNYSINTIRLSDDPDDYYKFTIDKTLGIVVNWNIGTRFLGSPTTKLELLRSNGTLITSQNSDPYGGYRENISLGQNLDAGTYYLRFNTDSTATVNYDFTLIAGPLDNAGNDFAHAKDLGTIGTTPISQSDYVYSIYSGGSIYQPSFVDKGVDEDYYQFTLNQKSQVTFNLTDGENSDTALFLYQGSGGYKEYAGPLYNDFSQTSASLVTTLEAGTYSFYISGNGANDPATGQSTPAPYTLALSAVAFPDPGDRIDTAYDLGALNYSLTPPLGALLTAKYDDTIRLSDDPDDYYKFTIDKTLGIVVNWTNSGGTPPVYPNLGSTTKLEILRSDGTLVTSQNYGGSLSSLGQNLDAGTYYLRFNTDSAATVNYDFTLVAGPVDNAGNDFAHAKDLGTIGTTPIGQSDYVSDVFNVDDYYQFTLSQTSEVAFNLTDGENSYTYLNLYLGLGGSFLDSLSNSSSQTSASLVKSLGAGTYYFYISGNGAYNSATKQFAPASYTLTLSSISPNITLAVDPTSVTEDGTTNLVYTFTRTGATTNALTVNYGITGTAKSTDYTGATPGTGKTITFAAGSSTATLTIDPTADKTVEPNETVALTLAAGTGYTIATPTAVTGTIINDDFVKINLSPNGQTVVEGITSPQTLNYAVNLSNSSNQTITVHYNTANGTALAGSDYTAQIGTLTFSPGVTRQTITIPILNNSINEANETFTLKLTNPTHAVLGGVATVTTTITDTLSATVTTTLPANVENLKLNGTSAINGTGNAGNNIITGNNANNLLNGGDGNDRLNGLAGNDTLTGAGGKDTLTGAGGKDTLTGGAGNDRFGYKTLTDSRLASVDVITDFNATTDNDLFLVSTARAGFTNVGAVTALTVAGIGAKLTATNFAVNSAAQFTFGTRSFVAINNATAGFSATTDAIIEVTGLTGTLTTANFVTV